MCLDSIWIRGRTYVYLPRRTRGAYYSTLGYQNSAQRLLQSPASKWCLQAKANSTYLSWCHLGKSQFSSSSWSSAALGNWLGIRQRWLAAALCTTCFALSSSSSYYHYYYYYYFPFLFCPIKPSLSKTTNFTFFFHFLPHPTARRGVSEWLCGL